MMPKKVYTQSTSQKEELNFPLQASSIAFRSLNGASEITMQAIPGGTRV
jgi:hypothetical protein